MPQQYTYDFYNVSPASSLTPMDSAKSTGAANKVFGGYNKKIAMVQLQPFPDFTNKKLVHLSLHCYLTDTQGSAGHQTYIGLITGNFDASTSFANLYAMCKGAPNAYAQSTNTASDMADVAECDLVPIGTITSSATWFDIDLTGREIMNILNANPAAYKGFWMGLGFRGQHECRITTNVDNTLYLHMVLEDAYTQCQPPASIGVSATNVAPGAGVILSWPNGSPGIGMSIDHYDVYRSVNGGASYEFFQSVWGTSLQVSAPSDNGAYYLYKVLTVGTVAGFNSGLSGAYAALACSFSAPTITSVTIDGGAETYRKIGESAILAWAAANGTNNPVTRYHIYRDGVYYTETTNSSLAVPVNNANGGAYTYSVYAIGTYSNSGVSPGRVVYTYSDPLASTAVSVSAGLANAGSNITLSWSGAWAGYYNAIRGYHVYRATAPEGPYSFLAEILTADTSGSAQVAAHGTEGVTYYYRVYTLGVRSNSAISGVYASVKTNSTPAAPSSLRFGIAGGSSFYNGPQCLWSNGGDADGNFTGVYIRLSRYNHDQAYGAVGWDWLDTAWVWVGNVSSLTYTRAQLIAKGAKAGDALAFGLVSQDALSLQNWGAAGMTASGYVYIAADPTAPNAFTASPAIHESGVTLAWSGASGGGIAITGYDIEYKVASTATGVDGVDGFATADGSPFATSGTSGSKADSANISRGYFERWRIRTTTAEGTKSAWKYSNTIQKNRVPIAPLFLFPTTGRTTYNTQPYVGLSISGEPDAQVQTLYYSIDGGAAQNAGAVSAGTKKKRMPAMAVGNHTIKFWLQDSLGAASGEVTVTITIAANSYSRTITGYVSAQQPGTLLWDEVNALRTSTEILELKGRVNQIRAYYGFTAINLPYEATTGSRTIKHFHTWMPNMAALYQGLADTGTISGASVPARVIKDRNAPSAAVVNQVRAMIGSL